MTRRRALLIWVIGWLLAGVTAVCTLAPTARADDLSDNQIRYILDNGRDICQAIASQPDRDGLLRVAAAILGNGWTADEAGPILASTVERYCPQWIPLIKRVAAQEGRSQLA
jgi:hypothetical protein